MSCSCHQNPCRCAPSCDPDHEPLASALNNFITAFFGSVTKTCVNGEVVWQLPCNLEDGLSGFPRVANEGLACYFLRVMASLQAAVLAASFVNPDVGDTVTIEVDDSSNFTAGETVNIGGNTYLVTNVDDTTHITIQNLGGPNPPGSVVPSTTVITVVGGGATGSFDIVTNVDYTSPDISQTKVSIAVTNGLITAIGTPVTTVVTTAIACP